MHPEMRIMHDEAIETIVAVSMSTPGNQLISRCSPVRNRLISHMKILTMVGLGAGDVVSSLWVGGGGGNVDALVVVRVAIGAIIIGHHLVSSSIAPNGFFRDVSTEMEQLGAEQSNTKANVHSTQRHIR